MMNRKKKLLIAGDFTNPINHSFGMVSCALEEIFSPEYDVELGEHYESIALKGFDAYDGIVFYSDHWTDKSQTVPELLPAVLTHVARGGGLVCLHSLDMAYDDETAQLIGARKNGESMNRGWTFSTKEHEITRGLTDFQMQDTLDQPQLAFLPDTKILLTTVANRQEIPVAWCAGFGLGRVVTILAGHSEEVYRQDAFRAFVSNCVTWVVNQL